MPVVSFAIPESSSLIHERSVPPTIPPSTSANSSNASPMRLSPLLVHRTTNSEFERFRRSRRFTNQTRFRNLEQPISIGTEEANLAQDEESESDDYLKRVSVTEVEVQNLEPRKTSFRLAPDITTRLHTECQEDRIVHRIHEGNAVQCDLSSKNQSMTNHEEVTFRNYLVRRFNSTKVIINSPSFMEKAKKVINTCKNEALLQSVSELETAENRRLGVYARQKKGNINAYLSKPNERNIRRLRLPPLNDYFESMGKILQKQFHCSGPSIVCRKGGATGEAKSNDSSGEVVNDVCETVVQVYSAEGVRLDAPKFPRAESSSTFVTNESNEPMDVEAMYESGELIISKELPIGEIDASQLVDPWQWLASEKARDAVADQPPSDVSQDTPVDSPSYIPLLKCHTTCLEDNGQQKCPACRSTGKRRLVSKPINAQDSSSNTTPSSECSNFLK